jgi:hypothetical protein
MGASIRRLLSDWGIRLLFLFYLILSMVGFFRPLAAIGEPFGGFIWHRDHVWGFSVGWETGKGWVGRQAGLGLEDRILRIQGQAIPLDGQPDVIGQVYRRAETGELVDYEIERTHARGKELLHVQVPVTLFSWQHLLESHVPFFAASLTVWLIGFLVHRVCPVNRVGSLFALMCLAVSVTFAVHNYHGFANEYYYAPWPVSVAYTPGWPMLTALAVHFFSVFPEPRPWWPRIRPWVYGMAVVLAVVRSSAFTPWGDPSLVNPLVLPITLFSVAGSMYGIGALVSSYRRSPSPHVRQVMKLIGIGLCLGLLIPFLSAGLPIRSLPALFGCMVDAGRVDWLSSGL